MRLKGLNIRITWTAEAKDFFKTHGVCICGEQADFVVRHYGQLMTLCRHCYNVKYRAEKSIRTQTKHISLVKFYTDSGTIKPGHIVRPANEITFDKFGKIAGTTKEEGI